MRRLQIYRREMLKKHSILFCSHWAQKRRRNLFFDLIVFGYSQIMIFGFQNLYTLVSLEVEERLSEGILRRLARAAITAMIPSYLRENVGVHALIQVDQLRLTSSVSFWDIQYWRKVWIFPVGKWTLHLNLLQFAPTGNLKELVDWVGSILPEIWRFRGAMSFDPRLPLSAGRKKLLSS